MAKGKNAFGGGNPHSLYVPLSEDEQEVLHRLVDSQTLTIVIHPWNIVTHPSWVGVGDKRVAIKFPVTFKGPKEPTQVKALDLELKGMGVSLMRKLYPTILPDGNPLLIMAGLSLELQWDIAIDHMNPKLVKLLKPGAIGLTSRRIDKDSGERTVQGNMKLDKEKKDLLEFVEKGEVKSRQEDVEKIRKLTKDDQ